MTSVAARAAGSGDPLPCFRKRMAWRFAEAIGMRQRLVTQSIGWRAEVPAPI